ncbi:MAG: glycosyltransferase family 39 protein [Thermodesulfobacteriota bacterium]
MAAARGAEPSSAARRMRWPALAIVALALLASLGLHLWGVERNLPDGRDVDEDALLRPAIRIAASGDLNPRWFGYPGSTVIYPLAALLHVREAAWHGGSWTSPNRSIRARFFAGDFASSARTGRYLSIAYGVASVALAAWVGWLAFGPATAAVGAVLAAASPLAIEYAQPLRSDSAATFFGLLYLALVLRALDTPTVSRHALAGAALGLAVASRFLMASTGAVLAAAQLRLWRRGTDGAPVAPIVAGWLAVPLAFFATTPYVLLAAPAALQGLRVAAQKQSVHVGIEPLGLLGNLRYYLAEAIPQAIGWPQYVLALLAVAVLAWRRSFAPLLLALYVIVFLVGISILGIHWQRWAVPALPVLAVLAAQAIVAGADGVARALRSPRGLRPAIAAGAALLVVIGPAREAARLSRLYAHPSTEVVTLDWVLANLPDGARIAHEWYTAPLASKRARAKRFKVLEVSTLSRHPLAFYRGNGWEYLLISTNMYGRYTRNPEAHPRQVAFYRRLRETATLLFEARPSREVRGPIVGVYRLPGMQRVDRRSARDG